MFFLFSRKLLLSPSLWGETVESGKTVLREAAAQLCVQFRGCAWCVRCGIYDRARFLCRALAAKVPGVLAGALLQSLALERRGWGCGVGTAVRNHTPF